MTELAAINLTSPQATSVLAQWLGRKVRCQSIVPLKGGICSPVFRLEFDHPPHLAVVKLQDVGDDDPVVSRNSSEPQSALKAVSQAVDTHIWDR